MKTNTILGFSVFFLIFLGVNVNNAFALDWPIVHSQEPIRLDNPYGDRFGDIWIIDAAPNKISIKLENSTMPKTSAGILLYDKYIQWNGKDIEDLKYNALTWIDNPILFEHILPVEDRYVIVFVSDEKSVLDKITISYNQVIHNELIGGAIIALVGVFIGAISGVIRDNLKDAGKTRTIKYTIRSDLEHIKNIITDAIESKNEEEYLMNRTKISSISTKVYDELHLEITRLLFTIYSNRIRTTYQQIKELTNPQIIVISDKSRAIKKTEIDSILKNIEELLDRLSPFYQYRLVGRMLKEKFSR